ncbi:FAD:protein FMN transferase [uncultured Shimia sp.]|uniref:FAD:protein FMN transferase n=1 Tax=uncultured Shimia sp. TaxID=573152 RepID=UPI00262FBFBE|nr:FAD:protein FMN transferase [uncultured Shimia sp.]
MTVLTRRRFLSITAASAALPAMAATPLTATWRGNAMGAKVSMKLAGLSQEAAAPIFHAVEAELSRLEGIFSLYRTESQLSQLNREGILHVPAPELLQVLSLSDRLNTASNGAFDPTIQTLWMATARGETGKDLDAARKLVGWQEVQFDTSAARLSKPGQALTLNGIAQGYITDRIAALLKRHQLQNVLLDMGEVAALGQSNTGVWSVGIAAPDGAIVKRLQMQDRALATSAPMGTPLGSAGHILSPQGQGTQRALVSVSADQAAVADGLSTTLCLLDEEAGASLVASFPNAKVEVSV